MPTPGLRLGAKRRAGANRRVAVSVALFAPLLIALMIAPAFLDIYWLRVFAAVFLYGTLAQSINLIAGFTGYPAFGNVMFFGLGAYGTGFVLVKLDGSFAAGLVAALGIAVIAALTMGPPLLRLRGHYFAIATVGLNEMIKAIVTNLTELTGGGMGLSLPLPPWRPGPSAEYFYYLLLSLMTACFLVSAWFSASRLGQAARAIRDDEIKAQAMGLRTTTIKTAAWTLSAAFTGLAGGIYAYQFSYIEPASVFDMMISVKAFVIFLFGGAATLLGPVVSAFIIELSSTFVWSRLLNFHLGLLGLLIMLIAIFMPHGVLSALRSRRQALAGMLRARQGPV